jgi:hypothetical protein
VTTATRAAPAESPKPPPVTAAPVTAQTPSDHPSIVDSDELGEWPTRPPPAPLADAVNQATGVPPATPVASAPRVEDAPDKYESRERLVAAPSVGSEEPAQSPAAIDASAASAPEVEAVIEEDDSLDAEVAEVGEESAVEEAPASSRRTVTQQPEERIAQIAFGTEEPARQPLHTPPPESGRLPAAAAMDFDSDVTGVRDSAPVAPLRPDRTDGTSPALPERGRHLDEKAPEPQAAHAAPDRSPASARELVPEPTHPNLPEGDGVAEVIGEAQRFSPGTFVALVDASLAL